MQGQDDKQAQLPTLTREQLEQLSKPQLIDIVLLLQDRLRVLEEWNQKLEARVADLERQLG